MNGFKRALLGYRRTEVENAISERDARILDQRLREANECHDRSIASLDAITVRLEELEAQARGQATRIRMNALREAVEVSRA